MFGPYKKLVNLIPSNEKFWFRPCSRRCGNSFYFILYTYSMEARYIKYICMQVITLHTSVYVYVYVCIYGAKVMRIWPRDHFASIFCFKPYLKSHVDKNLKKPPLSLSFPLKSL